MLPIGNQVPVLKKKPAAAMHAPPPKKGSPPPSASPAASVSFFSPETASKEVSDAEEVIRLAGRLTLSTKKQKERLKKQIDDLDTDLLLLEQELGSSDSSDEITALQASVVEKTEALRSFLSQNSRPAPPIPAPPPQAPAPPPTHAPEEENVEPQEVEETDFLVNLVNERRWIDSFGEKYTDVFDNKFLNHHVFRLDGNDYYASEGLRSHPKNTSMFPSSSLDSLLSKNKKNVITANAYYTGWWEGSQDQNRRFYIGKHGAVRVKIMKWMNSPKFDHLENG